MRDPLLHPSVLLSMFMLGVNDHWAKGAYPGWLTGKLSDVAGLVFFPLLVELLLVPRLGARRGRWLAVWVSAVGFTAVKVSLLANGVWNEVVGGLYRAVGWAEGAALLRDPSDLVALSALCVPLFVIQQRGDP